MATPDVATLAARSGADIARLALAWPASSPALTVTLVETTNVVSLRHWPGDGSAALSTVLTAQGLPALPAPARACGVEPRLIWQCPNETLLLTSNGTRAAALLAALRPQPGALAFALDLASGTLVVELNGSAVDALLSRLVDGDSLPRAPGQASRVRMADIAVTVWRDAPDRVGLVVDRANGHYLARWLSYAADAM